MNQSIFDSTWSSFWGSTCSILSRYICANMQLTLHFWSTSSQKATSIATNYIKFFRFLWAFTWYQSWKEWCGSKCYIFKNLRNYFLKLLSFFVKHKHCQVGKIYQFLAINQLKIQITENLKCQQKHVKPVNRALYILWHQPRLPSIAENWNFWNLEEELLPKMGWRAGPIWSCPKKPPHPSF